MVTALHRPPISQLARLQMSLLAVALLAVLAYAAWALRADGQTSALWWVAGALLVLGYLAFMALEFALMAALNRRDPAARATLVQHVAAWWQEVCVAPAVFAWRQPFFWRRLPDSAPHNTLDNKPALASPAPRAPTVFVHGFVCNRGFWLPWMQALRAQDLPYTSVNLEPVFGSIDNYVPLIEDAIARAEALRGLPPVLICHSMGGLAARAWLVAQPCNAQRVAQVVTIGTPHHGTWLGRFSHMPNARQMRQQNDWLGDLERREAQRRPNGTYAQFTCWYSNADNIVFPTSTATLLGADNQLVVGAGHVAIAFHPTVLGETMARLAAPAHAFP